MSHDAPEKDMDDFFVCVVVVLLLPFLCDDEQRPQSRMFSSSIYINQRTSCTYVRTNVCTSWAWGQNARTQHSNICYVLRAARVCIGFIVLSILSERNKHCTVDWRRDPYSILNTLCHITPPPHTLCQRLWFHFAQFSHITVNTCTHPLAHRHTQTHTCAHTQTYRIPFAHVLNIFRLFIYCVGIPKRHSIVYAPLLSIHSLFGGGSVRIVLLRNIDSILVYTCKMYELSKAIKYHSMLYSTRCHAMLHHAILQ